MKSLGVSVPRIRSALKTGSVRQVLLEVLDQPGKPEKPVCYSSLTKLPVSLPGPTATSSLELTNLQDTLVAGVFLEKLLMAGSLPSSSWLSGQIKKALLEKVVGHITLEKFRQLMEQVDVLTPRLLRAVEEVQEASRRKLPLAKPSGFADKVTTPPSDRSGASDLVQTPKAPAPGTPLPSRQARHWGREVEVSVADLRDFFASLVHREFRLKDFEDYFAVNKAKAFIQVSTLVREGVLSHNGKRTAGVRYAPVSGWDRGLLANF